LGRLVAFLLDLAACLLLDYFTYYQHGTAHSKLDIKLPFPCQGI